MEFDNNKPIFLQICDALYSKILSSEVKAGDRIPSVREYGAEIGVNPNTIMRAYEKLTNEGVIFNKRGIGYFISPDATNIVLSQEREYFLKKEVPLIKRKLELLGLSTDMFKE
ncbi:MAG TPA: GntR family transcriptional regulator [Rikenellaceae bacterium]|nr:GntR family transcriptional regulator [Rikenellaceae bacterium]